MRDMNAEDAIELAEIVLVAARAGMTGGSGAALAALIGPVARLAIEIYADRRPTEKMIVDAHAAATALEQIRRELIQQGHLLDERVRVTPDRDLLNQLEG
jgi:hypothetical protein